MAEGPCAVSLTGMVVDLTLTLTRRLLLTLTLTLSLTPLSLSLHLSLRLSLSLRPLEVYEILSPVQCGARLCELRPPDTLALPPTFILPLP